jgi:uncharacterized protein
MEVLIFQEIIYPMLAAMVIAFFTVMGGVSGAFLLMPYQISILNILTPAASATNHIYNLIAIPGGLIRFIQEKRMIWPLSLVIVIGTLPGVILGAYIRVNYLKRIDHFKYFVGIVLLYICFKLIHNLVQQVKLKKNEESGLKSGKKSSANQSDFQLKAVRFSRYRIQFTYQHRDYHASILQLSGLSLVIGTIGGIYGIGGGSIMAPLLVSYFGLPVHIIAGAALFSTFITSITGVLSFQVLAYYFPTQLISPNWSLGISFGIGGMIGSYFGAKLQKKIPEIWIKLILIFCILFPTINYLVQ